MLRSKISLSVLLVAALIFSVVIMYVSLTTSGRAQKDAEALTVSTVNELGNKVGKIMDENINVLRSIASIIERIDRTNPYARKIVSDIMFANMTNTKDILSLWIAFEPNAFDNRDAEFARAGDMTRPVSLCSVTSMKAEV